MDAMGVLPALHGIAVHDWWGPYRTYPMIHAACNAHIVRKLKGVAEGRRQTWAQDMIALLYETHDSVTANGGKLDRWQMRTVRKRYGSIVTAGYRANPPPTRGKRRGYNKIAHPLLKRLNECRDDVLRFCTDSDVPFTNNLAERDIRMVKLQQKVSGSWRTLEGAQRFCAIRSYISTMQKNGQNLIAGLALLFEGGCWLPARS